MSPLGAYRDFYQPVGKKELSKSPLEVPSPTPNRGWFGDRIRWEYPAEGNYQTPNNEEKNCSEIGCFSSFNLVIKTSFSECLLALFLSP